MAKVQDSQMLTANRLVDGDVLYWKSGSWVLALAEGEVFAEPADAEAALAAAKTFVARNAVVAPYLFEVRTDARGVHPVKEREIIRAAGPTIRPDTGKQADSNVPV
jgi:tRNA(Ser,Leu) C12 N-acetylase TAN1